MPKVALMNGTAPIAKIPMLRLAKSDSQARAAAKANAATSNRPVCPPAAAARRTRSAGAHQPGQDREPGEGEDERLVRADPERLEITRERTAELADGAVNGVRPVDPRDQLDRKEQAAQQ